MKNTGLMRPLNNRYETTEPSLGLGLAKTLSRGTRASERTGRYSQRVLASPRPKLGGRDAASATLGSEAQQPFGRLIAVSLVLLFAASGCARIDPIERPELAETLQWDHQHHAEDRTDALNWPDPHWWHHFQSPQLDQLIEQANRQSPDLRAAAERVRQAEWQLRSTGSSLFPSINLGAGSSVQRDLDRSGDRDTRESTSANLSIGYEIDLWGELAAGRRSAEAGFRASEYDYVAARLSLNAAIANSWFEWLNLNERIEITRENIRISERVMAVVETRYRNGAASAADVARQRTSLLSQQASLAPLEFRAEQTRRALAVLVGQAPQTLELQPRALSELHLPPTASGSPTDLITRRPDLARIEAQLQAADANVAVARTAFLPSLSLSAGVSMATDSLFSLSGAQELANAGVSLSQAVFDGGRNRAQSRLSESRRRELLENYRWAILDALRETDDALGRVALNEAQEDTQAEILIQAERALALTETRYREGSDDLLTLLDAQRSLFQTRDELTQLRLERLTAAVDLYKALGGGWHRETEQ